MKLTLTSGRELRELLKCCGAMMDEVLLTINKDGLSASGINPEHTGFLKIVLLPEFFENFAVDEPVETALSTMVHRKLIQRLPTDPTELSFDKEKKKLIVTSKGQMKRTVTMSTIDVSTLDQPPPPQFEAKLLAQATIPSEVLSLIIAGANDISAEKMRLTLLPETIKSKYEGEFIVAEVEASEVTTKFKAEPYNVSSAFSTRLLGNIPTIASLSGGDVELGLGNEFPMVVTMQILGEKNVVRGQISYIIAPRLEEEEEHALQTLHRQRGINDF